MINNKLLHRSDENKLILRIYSSSDCKEMAELFYNTVHTVNAADYTKEQLDAWATSEVDLDKWGESFLHNYSIVAVENGIIVGFGDIDNNGYLDRLYVHKDYQGQGIANAICDKLEETANKIVTRASITAKPFFEKRGYVSLKEQQVIRYGVSLTNYIMEKNI